jgi:hypothetical protein
MMMVLGFEFRALSILGKYSTSWVTSSALFALVIFQVSFHISAPGKPRTEILLPAIFHMCQHAQLCWDMSLSSRPGLEPQPKQVGLQEWAITLGL